MSAIRIEEDPEWARERYSVEGAMGVGGGTGITLRRE